MLAGAFEHRTRADSDQLRQLFGHLPRVNSEPTREWIAEKLLQVGLGAALGERASILRGPHLQVRDSAPTNVLPARQVPRRQHRVEDQERQDKN